MCRNITSWLQRQKNVVVHTPRGFTLAGLSSPIKERMKYVELCKQSFFVSDSLYWQQGMIMPSSITWSMPEFDSPRSTLCLCAFPCDHRTGYARQLTYPAFATWEAVEYGGRRQLPQRLEPQIVLSI